jgi:hypothetical protein
MGRRLARARTRAAAPGATAAHAAGAWHRRARCLVRPGRVRRRHAQRGARHACCCFRRRCRARHAVPRARARVRRRALRARAALLAADAHARWRGRWLWRGRWHGQRRQPQPPWRRPPPPPPPRRRNPAARQRQRCRLRYGRRCERRPRRRVWPAGAVCQEEGGRAIVRGRPVGDSVAAVKGVPPCESRCAYCLARVRTRAATRTRERARVKQSDPLPRHHTHTHAPWCCLQAACRMLPRPSIWSTCAPRSPPSPRSPASRATSARCGSWGASGGRQRRGRRPALVGGATLVVVVVAVGCSCLGRVRCGI